MNIFKCYFITITILVLPILITSDDPTTKYEKYFDGIVMIIVF